MKTTFQYLVKILVILFVVFFVDFVQAKFVKSDQVILELDDIIVNSTHQAFKNRVEKIASNRNFNYRKALKYAKSINKYYCFNGFEISEVELLKYFKRAARRSRSVEEFVNYFRERDLRFLELLDDQVVTGLYNNVRKTTLNGLLDALSAYY
ncbi:hypothetical protein [Mesonia oceanica]|uniref:Uncharacterized protein n=1 Tax=Mesonia oceanica TaxID=2687242 RepID=A0AC61Y822_9FLAO|nr:hypothetical protein [Mesonia oceanica]MAQ41394.1 hypothetical protein [Mesonia sp.]MBJ98515.1 hypothetical protein [Flavobacteriaceae bacterium]VVV00504.1 hypothetical protein FVB9532_01775 [Mesonia oceanica]|tara:strand:+ start:534 stop:989 length:456 start_codon:yes stop_codon:yes gene_type:complete